MLAQTMYHAIKAISLYDLPETLSEYNLTIFFLNSQE